jgi:hypothetical protein
MTDISHHDLDADLKTTVLKFETRIGLLEATVDDLGHALEHMRQEHENELAQLKAKIAAMQGYRDEQIARAIAQHETEVLVERLNAAKRRHSVLCSPGNML